MNEELETLKRIKGHFNPKDIANKELFEKDFNTIEKALKREKKQASILKLIKEKKIDATKILECGEVSHYNSYVRAMNNWDISKYYNYLLSKKDFRTLYNYFTKGVK